jgi:hypothetical protein
VHARDRIVIDAQVGRGQLADLDDRLGEGLFLEEIVPFPDFEFEGYGKTSDN